MNDYFNSYIIYFGIFLQLIGLSFAVVVDPYIKKKHRIVILINNALTLVLIIQNYMEYIFSSDRLQYLNRIYSGIVGYSVRPLILMMWIYLIRPRKKHIAAWALTIINALIHLTALFTDICFTIKPTNTFSRGPLGYTCHIISAVLLLYLFWLSSDMYIEWMDRRIDNSGVSAIRDVSDKSPIAFRNELIKYGYGLGGLIPAWCVIMIIVSVILDLKIFSEDATISFLTVAIVSCNLFYYIWLHIGLVGEREKRFRAE